VDEVNWFGPSWGAAMNRDCPECPVPLDQTCIHCGEGFVLSDPGVVTTNGVPFHLVGSASHQLKKCYCYGGEWEDPPELTTRQAARLALDLWEESESRRGRTA
jgi:hypothetical protein